MLWTGTFVTMMMTWPVGRRVVQEKLLMRLLALTIDEIAVRDLPRLLDVAVKVADHRVQLAQGNAQAAHANRLPGLRWDRGHRLRCQSS